MKELHLFIIWHNARQKEEKVISQIAKKFEILQTFEVKWSEELFSDNLARFYGKKLPKSNKKKEQCGTDSFLFVAVFDHNPKYIDGKNVNVTSAKHKYRQLVGGKNLVHASDNVEEATENILFLLGLNSDEFLAKYNKRKSENILINQEVIGAPEWKDETSLLNFAKKIPQTSVKKIQDTHMIVTEDISTVCRLLNASKRLFFMKRNLYQIPVGGSNKFVYIRKPI